MRRIIAIVLIMAVGGCVRPAPQLPAGKGVRGPGSTDWSAVQWLPRGQFIIVTVDGGETRAASLHSVSDTAVTLWYDSGTETIPRASVTHVAARVQIGEKEEKQPQGDFSPIGVADMGGAFGYAVWSAHKNKNRGKTPWGGVAAAGALALLWDTSVKVTKPVYEDRLVYIRP